MRLTFVALPCVLITLAAPHDARAAGGANAPRPGPIQKFSQISPALARLSLGSRLRGTAHLWKAGF